jgi:hypothetical protein
MKSFSKKNILAILSGLFVIILLRIIIAVTVSPIIAYNASLNSNAENYISNLQSQYSSMSLIFNLISFFILILGGFVVGKIVKSNGWIYGAILGLIFVSFGVVTAILRQTWHFNMVNSVLNIVLISLGGYLGDKVSKKSSKH